MHLFILLKKHGLNKGNRSHTCLHTTAVDIIDHNAIIDHITFPTKEQEVTMTKL